MEKKAVMEFFDQLAPTWDDDMITNDDIIKKILDAAGICEGSNVLDVACGTGVLFPYYLDRMVKGITGVDISPNMIKKAREKFPDQEKIRLLCCDIEELDEKKTFDAAVVYNALPHFADPEKLIESLAGQIKTGGTLTIAHGMSLEKVNAHHSGTAKNVSRTLMPAKELAALFEKNFGQIQIISDDDMYLVSGRKRSAC